MVKFTGNLHLSVTREDSSDIDINSYVLEWTSKSILMYTFCIIVEITHVMDTGYPSWNVILMIGMYSENIVQRHAVAFD